MGNSTSKDKVIKSSPRVPNPYCNPKYPNPECPIVESSPVQVPGPKCPICDGPMGDIGPSGPYGEPGLITLLGKCGHEESRGIPGPPGRNR